MFTPYERRQLRQIEEWFEQDDPQLAQTLRSGPVRKPSHAPQMLLIGLAVALGVLGVAANSFVLIFSAMITGVVAFGMVTYRRKNQS
jgi:hypothetical protein